MKKSFNSELQNLDLKEILTNLPGYIYWKNIDSIYMGCNINLAKISGLKIPDDIIGKTDKDFYWGSKEGEDFQKEDQEVMLTGKIKITENKLPTKNKDNQHMYVRTEKIPLYNSGKVIGVLGVAVDISERKRYETALQISNEKLEIANEAKSDFLSIMGHELRKPLNNILGLLYLIKETSLNEDQLKLIELLYSSVANILPVLDYANEFIEIEKIDYEPYEEVFSVLKLVEAVIKKISNESKSKDIDFFIEAKDNLFYNLIFDAYRLSQILK